MATVEEIHNAQRAEGPATILAIGTATPANCVHQSDYPDYYFRVTNSEHQTQLKEKLKRICENSTVKKRYLHLTEEMLKKNKQMCEHKAPSLDVRQDILRVEVPKLGKEAAVRAIEEWGQSKSKISHVIFCATGGVDMPGADYQLTKLLDLQPSVRRVMIYQQGCFAGGTALRLAKDLAENNKGARVLLVCSEITLGFFRGPSPSHVDTLIGQAFLGDGAAAVVVGSDPVSEEKPLFQVVSAAQRIVPDGDGGLTGHLTEAGLMFHLSKDVPTLISRAIENCVVEACEELDIKDWNSLFWILHPGGPAIMSKVETKFGLEEEKLRASRDVMASYGNLSSASVFFILDEMRRHSKEKKLATTGEGLEWGVLFGYGAGLTVETIVLHSSEV